MKIRSDRAQAFGQELAEYLQQLQLLEPNITAEGVVVSVLLDSSKGHR